jgi:hypothetical protein
VLSAKAAILVVENQAGRTAPGQAQPGGGAPRWLCKTRIAQPRSERDALACRASHLRTRLRKAEPLGDVIEKSVVSLDPPRLRSTRAIQIHGDARKRDPSGRPLKPYVRRMGELTQRRRHRVVRPRALMCRSVA